MNKKLKGYDRKMTGGGSEEINETKFLSRVRIHIEMERTRDMSLGYRERQPSPQLDRYGLEMMDVVVVVVVVVMMEVVVVFVLYSPW